jgi:hypothetical protein
VLGVIAVNWNDRYRQVNLYDCFSVNGGYYLDGDQTDWTSCRIFGNANIGNARFTNLQVAGQLTFDDDIMLVQRWYARTDMAMTQAAWKWSEQVQVTCQMGYHNMWQLPLSDLLERRPRYSDSDPQHERPMFDPFPFVLPPRQNISVLIDNFTANHAHRDLITSLDASNRLMLGSFEPPLVWIHLEGVRVIDGQIPELMDMQMKKTKTVEERIIHWVLKMRTDDDANNAQIDAIADGILEGRHRQ